MLRVLLSALPSADRPESWVRYAVDGRILARGRDVPARWPGDPNLEIVLAAAQVRLAALALPPMPRNRVRQAVRYALEDQMASAGDEAAIAVASPGVHQGVVAAIASETLVRALGAYPRRIVRIIPEPALAPYDDGWTWYASAADGGFVRRADGSAFAVGSSSAGAVPAELHAALAQARRAGVAPIRVRAALPVDATQLVQWSDATAADFIAAPVWQWENATPAAFAAAPDFLADDAPRSGTPVDSSVARWFYAALTLAALALLLHGGGLLVHWAWLNAVDWQLSRALVAEAAAGGLSAAATPSAAAAAIARRNAELRHRASKSAADDALPLLARAAPAIAELPGGSLRSATYANRAWTIEFGRLDAQSVSRVTRALARSGVDAVSAPTAGGTRMRLALDAAAR